MILTLIQFFDQFRVWCVKGIIHGDLLGLLDLFLVVMDEDFALIIQAISALCFVADPCFLCGQLLVVIEQGF